MARAGLTPDAIVAAAITFTDEQGLDALTLTALAKSFGVAPPALYKHVGGLADLRRRMRLQLLAELTQDLRSAATARSGRDALNGVCDALRAFATRHRGAYALTLTAPGPDPQDVQAGEAAVQVLWQLVGSYGLDGQNAVDAARAVRSALHGFITLELTGAFGLPRNVDDSFTALKTNLDRLLAAWQ